MKKLLKNNYTEEYKLLLQEWIETVELVDPGIYSDMISKTNELLEKDNNNGTRKKINS